MTDLHPPPNQLNNNNGGAPPSTAAPPLPPENVGTKRQRRPSVRLGDIGDQSFDSHPHRKPKWKLPITKDPNKGPHRVRPGANLARDETLGNLGGWRVKDSKSSRRGFSSNKRAVTSNWASSKIDEGRGGEEREEVDEEGFRDFRLDSPLTERSPVEVDSLGNELVEEDYDGDEDRGKGFKGDFARVLDGEELEGPSDSGARNWNNNNNDNDGNRGQRNGVRVWLNELGLGRYAPVFEIHEVDDEVLPLLTLEDLRDMGINAVGSRRKMYCAIQKMRKGFT